MFLNAPCNWAKPTHKEAQRIKFVEFLVFVEFMELEGGKSRDLKI